MGEAAEAADRLPDIRRRAPVLSAGDTDYGLLPSLTGFSIKLAWILGHNLIMRELGDPAVTPHRFSVLEVAGCNPGVQPRQIAAALALTRPATTLALHFWEDRGCIERRKLPDDRRSYGIHLTSAGSRELARLRRLIKQADTALTSSLTDGETRELRRILKKIHL